ncbi:MAG TPA: response regulator [Mesorhizobium sp.]|nr:response regulator [Mesorhizobium sp.]
MRKHPQRGQLKVLVVDDEPLVRFMTADVLKAAGFSVTEAGNSEEALQQLNGGNGLAALVTDINMPGKMNGCALARHVRARYPSAAIVIISGVEEPDPEALPARAVFLAKPLAPERLIRRLGEIIEAPEEEPRRSKG